MGEVTDVDEAPMRDLDDDVAIDVRVINSKAEKTEAADLAAHSTWILSGTETPFQVLPQNKRRHKAVLIVSAGAALAAVVVGRRSQVENSKATVITGTYIQAAANGSSVQFIYEAQSALWLVPFNGQAVTVSVVEQHDLAVTSE